MPSRIAVRVLPPRTRRQPEVGRGFRVFIDFDNTITIGDVLDGVIDRFAVGNEWRELEAAWAAGALGARACLDGQMRCLRGTWNDFERHLAGVRLDPGFRGLLEAVRRQGAELTILSDNFDCFVDHILRRNGFADVPHFCNHLECVDDRVIPSFPYGNPDCPGCAHCKKTHFVPPNDDGRTVIYIGDGRSDLCPARHADIVFAKDSLLRSLRAERIPCHEFTTLADVTIKLSTLLHANPR